MLEKRLELRNFKNIFLLILGEILGPEKCNVNKLISRNVLDSQTFSKFPIIQ